MATAVEIGAIVSEEGPQGLVLPRPQRDASVHRRVVGGFEQALGAGTAATLATEVAGAVPSEPLPPTYSKRIPTSPIGMSTQLARSVEFVKNQAPFPDGCRAGIGGVGHLLCAVDDCW